MVKWCFFLWYVYVFDFVCIIVLDHHGPPKVNFWEAPMSPSTWKEEHVSIYLNVCVYTFVCFLWHLNLIKKLESLDFYCLARESL